MFFDVHLIAGDLVNKTSVSFLYVLNCVTAQAMVSIVGLNVCSTAGDCMDVSS